MAAEANQPRLRLVPLAPLVPVGSSDLAPTGGSQPLSRPLAALPPLARLPPPPPPSADASAQPPLPPADPPQPQPQASVLGSLTRAPIDLSVRRCEEAFVVLARSRSGTIDSQLLLALLQMLGLKLSPDDFAALLLAKARVMGSHGRDTTPDDVHDLVDVLGMVDMLRSGIPRLPRPPNHHTRYAGPQPWARVDPLLMLSLSAVNGRLLRTQPPPQRAVQPLNFGVCSAASAAHAAHAASVGSGRGGGGSAALAQEPAPLPQIAELTSGEKARLHRASRWHVWLNKPSSAAEALCRIYALVALGSLAVVGRVTYGPADGCGRLLGTYLLGFGALLLSVAAMELFSSTRQANRNPELLLRVPLETGPLELVLDVCRALVLGPGLLVWTVVGLVWALRVSATGAPLGTLQCRGSPELFVGSVAALAATCVLLCYCLLAVAVRVRVRALRGRKQIRHDEDEDEELGLGAAR